MHVDIASYRFAAIAWAAVNHSRETIDPPQVDLGCLTSYVQWSSYWMFLLGSLQKKFEMGIAIGTNV